MAGLSPEEEQVLKALQDAGVHDPNRYKPYLACLHAGNYRSAVDLNVADRSSLLALNLPPTLVDNILEIQIGEGCLTASIVGGLDKGAMWLT